MCDANVMSAVIVLPIVSIQRLGRWFSNAVSIEVLRNKQSKMQTL
jgi:hypothetical protein